MKPHYRTTIVSKKIKPIKEAPLTVITQERWDEIFEQRCNELEDMPGGRQGANPDMSDLIVEGDEDE